MPEARVEFLGGPRDGEKTLLREPLPSTLQFAVLLDQRVAVFDSDDFPGPEPTMTAIWYKLEKRRRSGKGFSRSYYVYRYQGRV